jgi:hypothetical protein
MSESQALGPISPAERLARFITREGWVRVDGTIRQDAFIPPRDLNLSVTRHINLSERQIWMLGQRVANALPSASNPKLLGRADLAAIQLARLQLRGEPAPLGDNPNHAHITGWPTEKPKQKTLAQQLAAEARYVARPEEIA